MIKLEPEHYDKVIESLKNVTINTLFAKSVIHRQIPGSVYVDSDIEPKAFYIAHPYGMSLLFGDTDNESFNRDLFRYLINKDKAKNKSEWLQVFPSAWSAKIETNLGPYFIKKDPIDKNEVLKPNANTKIVENTRVNFIFDHNEYKKATIHLNRQEYVIVRTTKEMFRDIQGSVIPKYFWKDENEFQNAGVGYSLMCDGEIASTAFSAYRLENQLEIGIETMEKYKGKGFALQVCSAIIDYCLENGLEPVWGCRMENTASYQLAQRLGFVPSLFISYYQLLGVVPAFVSPSAK